MGADHSKMWSQSTKGYFKIQGFVRNKTIIVLQLSVCFCMCVFFKDREYFVIQVEWENPISFGVNLQDQ